MTIKELKTKLLKSFKDTEFEEDASADIYLIMEKVLNMKKEELIAHDDKKLLNFQIERIENEIKEVIKGKPVQYIVGEKSFMGENILVNENVLIPRPETELLVENAALIIKKIAITTTEDIRVLDLCSGSGCISIALLQYLKNNAPTLYGRTSIVSTDVSAQAIEVMKKNRELKHIPENKMEIIQCDMFSRIPSQQFDIIISNPPYIKTKDIDNLASNVKNEPHLALDGGEDGLMFYTEIAANAEEYLKNEGYLILEIGEEQAQDVSNILKEVEIKSVLVKKDLNDLDRIIIAKKWED